MGRIEVRYGIYRIILLVIIVMTPLTGFARALYVEDYGYFVDIPEGWEILDGEDLSKVAFTDALHQTIFQILSLEGSSHDSAEVLYGRLASGLKVKGERVAYTYAGMDAVFADVSFPAASQPVKGYFVIINGDIYDYALLMYTPTAVYEKNHDFMLSALDSFAAGPEQLVAPGPVTQFLSPFSGENDAEEVVDFFGNSLRIPTKSGAQEASQALIEREARVLASYEADRAKAWERYYRIVYRDSYSRLGDLSHGMRALFRSADVSQQEIPRLLLLWLQGQQYERTGTFSDLLAPLTSVTEARGDCDSRGIVYSILLSYFGIDSLLLVSSEYSHSVSAVDTSGSGARYDFEGKGYLIAELTDDVEIGLIAADMADPAGWQPIRLGYQL